MFPIMTFINRIMDLAVIAISLTGICSNTLLQAQNITPGSSIDFATGDFDAGHAAQKRWAIHGNDTDQDTLVQGVERMQLDGGRNASFRPGASAKSRADAWVCWKITVPSDRTIRSLTWAFARLQLEGAGDSDDSVAWQYSLDGREWKNFYIKSFSANRQNFDRQSLSIRINVPATAIYIRLFKIEGPQAEDQAFFRIASNLAPGGGFHPTTFVKVVAPPKG